MILFVIGIGTIAVGDWARTRTDEIRSEYRVDTAADIPLAAAADEDNVGKEKNQPKKTAKV